jgi:hypothetical protein
MSGQKSFLKMKVGGALLAISLLSSCAGNSTISDENAPELATSESSAADNVDKLATSDDNVFADLKAESKGAPADATMSGNGLNDANASASTSDSDGTYYNSVGGESVGRVAITLYGSKSYIKTLLKKNPDVAGVKNLSPGQKIYFDFGITRGGSGTATITEHEGTLQLGAGVTPGAWGNVPGIALLHGQDPWNLDFRCRIQSLSGGNSADVYIAAGIRETVSGSSNAGIFINARGDGGSLTMYAETVPISGSIATTATTRGDLAGGNFWMRVAISGAQVYGFYGIGAGGYQPTNWQMIGYYISANNHTTTRLANCIMTLDAVGGGSPDNVTVLFDNAIIALK